jgi:hypothetical protein
MKMLVIFLSSSAPTNFVGRSVGLYRGPVTWPRKPTEPQATSPGDKLKLIKFIVTHMSDELNMKLK